jgi:hypothetical protein
MGKVRTALIAKRRTADPAWESVKAARRNIRHDDAVQETIALARQFHELWGHCVTSSPVDLILVLKTLSERRIPFVLTGCHGIGSWTGRPRATKDVDILVKGGRNHDRATKAIAKLYPQLERRDFAGAAAFFVAGSNESVIDVVFPYRADQEETLAHPVWTENKEHGLRYRVPSLEAALANKYGAMLTATRDARKRQMDAVDFGWMVVHSLDAGCQAIDLQKLETLGDMVWPGGGGQEILRLVEQAKAGKPINFDTLGA